MEATSVTQMQRWPCEQVVDRLDRDDASLACRRQGHAEQRGTEKDLSDYLDRENKQLLYMQHQPKARHKIARQVSLWQ